MQNSSYGTWHHDDFYDDPVVKQWYKNYAEALITRVNSYTGVAYKDDPVIL